MNERAKIRRTTMIVLGMGQLGALFFWSFHSASMSLFLNDFTDSKYMIGLVLSLAGIANCLVPVIIGNVSDRTHSRFGRRRPYIFAGALIMFGSTMALPHMPTFGAVTLMAGLVFLSAAFCVAPYLALVPDITPTEQLGTASGYVNFMGGIGLIAYQAIGVKTWDNYPTETIYMVAIVFVVSMFVTVAFIKEPSASATTAPERMSFRRYFGSIAKETNTMKFLGSAFFFYLGLVMIYPFVTLFLVENMQVSEGKSILAILAASVVETLFILPLGILSDRVDRKKFMSYMLLLLAATSPAIALSQNFTHAIIAMGLMGIPIAAVVAVGYAFFLDLIPQGRAAEFVGLYAFCIGLAQFVALQAGGKLIDIIGFRLVFVLGGIFVVLGFVLFQFIKSPNRKKVAPQG